VRYLKGFFIVLFTVGVLAFSIVLYHGSEGVKALTGWESSLVEVMYYYLVFIFLRTAIHLFLAFASLFFSKRRAPLSEFPLVSVLVPCYNEDKVVREALASVQRLTYPNYEIIVIDDGSVDATLDELASLHSAESMNGRIRVVHQKNAGKAEALNRGMMEAQGDFVFCMDADGVLSPDVLERGMVHMKNPQTVAVAGSVVVGNQINALTRFQALEYISGLNLFKEAQSFLGMVTVIPGPVGLFRKHIVLANGGYRSDTLAEDCELTLRLLVNGYRTVYEPLMIARTEVPDEFTPLMGQRYRWSRGVLKAIKLNAEWFWKPWKNFRNFLILAYMIVESFVIPSLNFIFSFASINYALVYGVKGLYGYFFGQLIILDVTLAIFCLALETHMNFWLVFYAIMNRFTYGMSLEILRFFSIFDEIMGLPLYWGKLVRKGM